MDSPFHYVRFGCAMNIKNLGYPYERFTVCIRTYLSVVALLLLGLFLRYKHVCLLWAVLVQYEVQTKRGGFPHNLYFFFPPICTEPTTVALIAPQSATYQILGLILVGFRLAFPRQSCVEKCPLLVRD